ncbi:endonuclease domain-containing protein [Mycobacterium sp. 23]|uniref:endonuclease domain-containing protein n=1 Tax=Mycobacterium sp. 23 TaxID=3400424 RepID=UPI003AADB7AD
MNSPRQPFIGSEALAAGVLSRHELRTYYRAIMPNVYLDKRIEPSLQQRTTAAWLWSRQQAVIAGAAASALHGSRWIDQAAPIELIWRNARAPQRVITRADLLLDGETQVLKGLSVTTPERTAFDIGRRGALGRAVADLDALAAATDFKVSDVVELSANHRHARGLRKLEAALELVDAGAQSPKETWLRLLLIEAGFPTPRTQIPVLGRDGFPRYFLDMGWEDILLAVEYDGDQHWTNPAQHASDVDRLEYLNRMGWTVVRVVSRHRPTDVIRRVRCAWDTLTRR